LLPRANAESDAGTFTFTDANAVTQSVAYANAIPHTYAFSVTESNTNAVPHANALSLTNTNTNSNAISDSERNALGSLPPDGHFRLERGFLASA
jgi:hypothetical protein